MARRKIRVVVTRPKKPLLLGDFSKILFITKDADKDYKKYTTLKEVETDYGSTSLMYKGINTFLSQEDFDGNRLQPTEWYCAGKTTPNETFLNGLPEGEFYGIVVTFYDKTFIAALSKYLTRLGKFAVVINTDGDKTPTNLKESKRIYYLFGTEGKDNLDIFGLPAWTFVQGINGRWSDRRILGVEPSCNDSTKQSKLEENFINYTESRVGFNAVTNASWCADGMTHADQTIKIDAIVHTIDVNLTRLLIMQKNTTMDGEGIPTVEDILNRVMIEMGKQGAVAKDNNKDYLFKVTVPSIEDTSPETGLTVDDYIKRNLRNVKIDFTITTEVEEIDVELVWHDEPLQK